MSLLNLIYFFIGFSIVNCLAAVFGSSEDCDPQIADTCFTDVQDDLRVIFNPSNYYSQVQNESVLRDLCSAWDDSLACTYDVIDDDCNTETSRKRFIHWNNALRITWKYVCSKDTTVLKDVFTAVNCFNIPEFLDCVEKTAELVTIEDLMKTDLNDNECKYLEDTAVKCSEFVSYGTCAVDVFANIQTILNVFFDAANCVGFIQKSDDATNKSFVVSASLTILSFAYFVYVYIIREILV